MNDIDALKMNIKSLSPTDLGIKFGEHVITKIVPNLGKPDNKSYDKKTQDNQKVEIKWSRAMKQKNKENFLINLFENPSNSFVKSNTKEKYLCNIQQIKPYCFDILYYGLIFDDKILIFKIESIKLLNDTKNIGYSNKQHKGNDGEGQFHITSLNLQYHIDNYLYRIITWNELVNLLKTK
jgi:hypothetical protein